MSSTWGNSVKLSIFGGSHTEAIGVVIDGLPAGEPINFDEILVQMSRRAPGKDSTSTPRKESDFPKIISGYLNGKTTGAPLCAVIENTNVRSRDYSDLKAHPRPGHADYTAFVKYGGNNDIRGGGHFSGRLTACLVFAGAVCRQILARKGIFIGAHALSVHNISDSSFDPVLISKKELFPLSQEYFPVLDFTAKKNMTACIENAREKGDSVGGIVECAAVGVPAGIGSPMFGGIENIISSVIYGIPAVKGVEFGDGFAVGAAYGSQNNDEFYYDTQNSILTRTNHCGGILGGISTGMPIIFRAAVKPTPSIALEQQTVNLQTHSNEILQIHGRHDPCIVPRAVPVVENTAAIALLDLIAESGKL